MKDKDIEVASGEQPKNTKKKENIVRVILTAVMALVLLVFYRVSLSFSFFPIVMWSYMLLLTVIVLVYIFYNRGFSRKGITVDMLPDEWDEERKEIFVKSAEQRHNRSKWMLMVIIAFLVTFLVDAVELFILSNWFK